MRNDVTRALAEWAVEYDCGDMPRNVRQEGLRTFVNWVGCAVGGSQHETVEKAQRALAPFFGPPQATIIGRSEKVDGLHAAWLNGTSSHVMDYDDTHLAALTHPGGPVASAVFAMAETLPVCGSQILDALIVGVEIECRIALGVLPDHYDTGWHITSTAGVFGAAAAVGRLLDLDEKQMTWALGIAAAQAAGLREMFGTMCKSLHVGNAARNGAAAALLARHDFVSSDRAIEAPRGFASVASRTRDYSKMLAQLGTHWEILANSYKPYACGIVVHPAIEAAIGLRDELSRRKAELEELHLGVHPLVIELTGIREPRTGLEGKFSVYHAAAYGLVHGNVPPAAFTDEAVADPKVLAMRQRISTSINEEIGGEAVTFSARLSDGSTVVGSIDAVVGSVGRPLSDEQLADKFLAQATPIIGDEKGRDLLARAWRLDELGSAGELAELA